MIAIDRTTGKRINIDKNKLSIATIQQLQNGQTDLTILDVIDPNNIEVHLTPKEQEAFINIITYMCEGNSLVKALQEIKGLDKGKMYRCINLDSVKRNIYARADEERQAVLFERMHDIARDDSKDWYINDKGMRVPNPVAVQRSRLEIDTIDKMLARMNRKKYGNSVQIDAQVSHTAPLNMDQVNQILQELDNKTINIDHEDVDK